MEDKETKLPEIVKVIAGKGDKVYELMDAEDEKSIVNAELLDATLRKMVYVVPNTAEKTLTIDGIMECARRYKNIRMGIKKIDKTDKSYIAYAYAENLKDNITFECAVEQSAYLDNGQQDKFALVKAQSKAIRNCVKRVIPVNYFTTMINKFIEFNIKKMKEQKARQETQVTK